MKNNNDFTDQAIKDCKRACTYLRRLLQKQAIDPGLCFQLIKREKEIALGS